MGRIVAVALGSNLGDRNAHLRYAVKRLDGLLAKTRASRFIETDPVGVGAQPPFLNGVVLGESDREPRALLHELLTIEQERGRQRHYPGAPRTLDLDLILVDGLILDDAELVLPHPRFRDRLFVLGPLAEVAPDLVDPVTGLTVRELLDRAATGD